MRWSTTLALLALEKLRQNRKLEESDQNALCRFGADLKMVAEQNEHLKGEVFLVRRLSGDRPSGSLRRLLAMNSPKLSAMTTSSLEDASEYIAHLVRTGFAPPATKGGQQDLTRTLSTCQAVLGAI